MSVKINLYEAIKTAIEAIPSIKNVLHYNGQEILNYEKDIPKRFPQCWIQLTSIEWNSSEQRPNNANITQQQKTALVNISIYTATFSLNEDNETFTNDLILVDLVYRALSMLEGVNFSPLQRVSESDISTNNNVRVWQQDYTSQLTENAIALNNEDVAPINLVITNL